MFADIINRPGLAIDLGTINTVVSFRGQITTTPTIVALDSRSSKLIAFGETARAMLGRTGDNIDVIEPLKDGVIADFAGAGKFISHIVRHTMGRRIIGPDVVLCHPSTVTTVEKRAIVNAATSVGATRIALIEEPFAAALGSGLPVAEPRGSLVCDIGGGTTDIAMISLGSVVNSTSSRSAGNAMTGHVLAYLKKARGLYVGPLTAERIKTQHAVTLGTEFEDVDFPVAGRDAVSGAPKEIYVSRREISEAIDPCIRDIIDHIRQLLIDVPPELAADVVECGVFLTGGGALTPGLSVRIRNDLGLPAFLVEDPLFAVVKGAARTLSDRAFLRVLQRNTMFGS